MGRVGGELGSDAPIDNTSTTNNLERSRADDLLGTTCPPRDRGKRATYSRWTNRD
jgi:hypothetical protein